MTAEIVLMNKLTLEHFDETRISLKDASTPVAIAIRFVRFLDSQLQVDSGERTHLEYQVEYLGLVKQYKATLDTTDELARNRRMHDFCATHRLPRST